MLESLKEAPDISDYPIDQYQLRELTQASKDFFDHSLALSPPPMNAMGLIAAAGSTAMSYQSRVALPYNLSNTVA
jgi:hypothetical protein